MRKKLIRSILTLYISAISIGTANAQLGQTKEYVEPPGWSLGTTIGLLDLWGDVGTRGMIGHYTNDKYWGDPHFMGGIFVRYTAHPALAMRLGINYGTLYANDNWNKSLAQNSLVVEEDAYQRYVRNLSVKANTWEANLMFEINPLRLNPASNIARRRFQPFFLAGVGYMHFKPQAKYTDKAYNDRGYVNLYDLKLEGAGVDPKLFPNAPAAYDLWQLVVPMGVGIKWDIGRQIALGMDWVYRMTFTDYLDGVSGKYVDKSVYQSYLTPDQANLAYELQDKSWLVDPAFVQQPGNMRGNPSNKDSYSTLSVTLIYKIRNRKSPWWY